MTFGHVSDVIVSILIPNVIAMNRMTIEFIAALELTFSNIEKQYITVAVVG